MRIDYDVNEVRIKFPSDIRPLSWLSSGIENGIWWFAGRGTYQWSVEMSADVMDILMKAECKHEELQFSPVTPFRTLVAKGLFPAIPTWKPFRIEGENGTVISQSRIRPETSMADMAYGVADIIAGVAYKFGARKFRWAGSMELCEIWFDAGLSKAELEAYLADPQDYTSTTLIADMKRPRS